jgi:hypothetical protein
MGKGALTRPTKVFTPTVVEELTTLEHDLGGRRRLVGYLSLAPLTPDLAYILGLLGDPDHARWTLAEICAKGNILPGQLLQEIERAAHLRGRVLSAQVVAARLPAVVADVMKKAAPYEGACGDCAGTGTLTPDPTPQVPNPGPGPCETCRGTGQLLYQPRLEHQELALDMGRMLPKGQGLIIQQNNQNSSGQGGGGLGVGALEKLTQLTDKLLYGDEAHAPAAEAELVEPEGEGG